MNAREAPRKRSADDASHGAQPDPGSMVDDSMPELSRSARSACCGTGGGVFAPAASWLFRIECRCGDGPALGMGSGAMCLAFSQLQALNTKPDKLAELLEQGRRHLEFACSLAELQVERGGRVLFEHPWAATSWNEPCLRKLLAIDGMRRVRCDQCQFGMTSVDGAVNVGPARKATGLMTKDEYIAEAVNRRCFGGHDHIQLLNGRAKAC